jgi:nucleoside-diphosphate-sugar epimerase
VSGQQDAALSIFLIFGATGQVGTFLLPQLLVRGASVQAVSRTPPPTGGSERLEWIAGDLFDPAIALPNDAQVVVSLGPLDAFAAWFEREPLAGVRRVLALSSMSAQSKRASPDRTEREVAARLLAAEERLARVANARGIAWTVLRPTLIYGDARDRSLAPIVRFARRWRVLPIPIGADGLRQPVHAADVADAVAAAIDCAAAAGRIYPLGGGERLRFNDLLWRLRAALPGFVLPLPVPRLALYIARRLLAGDAAISDGALRRLREPLIADNSAAARDFGYAPRAFIAGDVLGGESASPRP